MSIAKQRNFGLDLVRAIAITLVLISHCSLLLFPDSQTLLKTMLMLGGALGVDIFFVLSGYLIGGILLKLFNNTKIQLYDVGYFWIRRWFRTLPNYFLALFINFILGYFLFKQLPHDVGSYFYFFQNFNRPQSEFFTESWSLSIEEFSYLLTPIAMLFFYGIRKNGKLAFLLGTIFLIVLATFFRIQYHQNEINIDYHYWTSNMRKVVLYRIDAICYGFLAIYLARYFKAYTAKYAVHFFCLGCVVILGLHAVIYLFSLTPNSATFLYNICYFPVIGIAFAIMHWYMTSLHSKWTKTVQFINYISTRSYAIYLTNYSMVLLSLQFLEANQLFSVPKPLMLLLFLALTLIISELMYRFYEKPMTNLREHPIFKKRKK